MPTGPPAAVDAAVERQLIHFDIGRLDVGSLYGNLDLPLGNP
jgi:hypothetical protein